jgi:hypothetical protein
MALEALHGIYEDVGVEIDPVTVEVVYERHDSLSRRRN